MLVKWEEGRATQKIDIVPSIILNFGTTPIF